MPDERFPPPERALDWYWDRVFRGDPAGPVPEGLDPELAASVRRVRALDSAPAADPAFASRLWEDLVPTQTVPVPFDRPGRRLLGDRATPRLRRPRRPTVPFPPRCRRWAIAHLATAVLVLLSLTAVVLTVGGRPDRQPVRLPAAQNVAATPAAAAALVRLTLTDLPPRREAQATLWRTTFDPGGSLRILAGAGPHVLYVEAGALRVAPVKAPSPLRVVRAGTGGAVEAGESVAAGGEARLEAGDTLVVPADGAAEMSNVGASPVAVLTLLLHGTMLWLDERGTERTPMVAEIVETVPPPHPSPTVVLERVTLAPGEHLPAPPAPAVMVVAPVEPASGDALSVEEAPGLASGAARNRGTEPLAVYVLTVTAATEPAGTPADGTPTA